MDLGYTKVSAASPRVHLAQPMKNAAAVRDALHAAQEAGVQVIAFPELFLTGYTCADLFSQQQLLDKAEEALLWLLSQTSDCSTVGVVGVPLRAEESLYNCAVVICRGRLLGVVPKMLIPNVREFYEKRWFSPGHNARAERIRIGDLQVPFGSLLFDLGSGTVLGVEICEDLWVAVPPSCQLALQGANIIANLSASNELAGKNSYRRALVLQQSARCMCGYVYACAGAGESSTDLVFGGNSMIAENGGDACGRRTVFRQYRLNLYRHGKPCPGTPLQQLYGQCACSRPPPGPNDTMPGRPV